MTTVVWDSWVEINPKTAAELGINFGDLVEVTSPQGSLRVPAVIYPGIRPDMVAMPLGQGHREMGRYAKGRGANPLQLLAHDNGRNEASTGLECNAGAGKADIGEGGTGDRGKSAGELQKRVDRDIKIRSRFQSQSSLRTSESQKS